MKAGFAAVAILLIAGSVYGEVRSEAFRAEMVGRLYRAHVRLVGMTGLPDGYAECEGAWRRAVADLEVYGEDPRVTRERVTNDVQEFEFDVSELADGWKASQ
jgi:hypothetical protein